MTLLISLLCFFFMIGVDLRDLLAKLYLSLKNFFGHNN